MYGAQTTFDIETTSIWFENDVEMYGAQTNMRNCYLKCGLRMM